MSLRITKRSIVILSVFLFITGLIVFNSKIIVWIAKYLVENAIPGSSVSIAGARFDPAKEIVLSNVNIKDAGFLDASIKKVIVRYSIPSVFTGSIETIEVNDADIKIDLTNGLPPELRRAGSSPPVLFHVREIAVSGTRMAIVDRDLSLNGQLAVRFSPNDLKVSHIDASIEAFKVRDVIVEGAHLAGPLTGAGATLTVDKIAAGKAVVSELRGTVLVGKRGLIVDPFDCRIFDGSVKGSIKAGLDQAHEYSIMLSCKGLNLETFIKDLKLEEKVGLTGRVGGDISMKGAGLIIKDLDGLLSAEAPGGVLIIRDPAILENIAKSSKEPVDILMESLKNYEYTIGTIKLALEGSGIVLDIAMTGVTGTRKFYVILHDMLTKKGGVL